MRYYYQDELGSTSHIADSSGGLIESYQYDVYGKPRVYDSGGTYQPNATPIAKDLFTGQRWHSELGLYDDRNRFMSPDLGRFLQPDPIGFKGDASNLYRYCGNDWANRSDPMGLETEIELQYIPVKNGNVHEYIVARDTKTGETVVSRAGPSENLHGTFKKVFDVYYDRPQKAVEQPGNSKGNIWLKADPIVPANKSPDVTKDSKSIPQSKVTLKDDLSAVKPRLQTYNDAVNAKKLDYQALSTNSNAFANSEYKYITGQDAPRPAPGVAVAPGRDINLTPMIQPNQIEPPKDQSGDMPLKDPEGDPFSLLQSLERR